MLPATTIRDRPRPGVTPWPFELWMPHALFALTRLAVPVAVLAAGWSLATFSVGDSGETVYLTTLTTLVLCAVAFLTPRPGLDLGLGATLGTLAIWVLPPGPTRGAGVTLLLLVVLAIAAARRWAVRLTSPGSGADEPARLWAAAFWTLVGLQALLGAGPLLDAGLDLGTAIRFLLLPAAAASAVLLLAQLRGLPQALIVAAVVGALGGGWSAGPTLALVALAAGSLLSASSSGALSHWGWSRIGWTRGLVRTLAGAAILAPLLWQQRAGAVAMAGGLILALAAPGGRSAGMGSGIARLRRALPLLPALAILAGAMILPLHAWGSALRTALWLPVLVPGVLLVLWTERALGNATLVLAVAVGLAAPQLSALAAPAALAVLVLPGRPGVGSADRAPDVPSALLRLGRIGGALQGVWSTALLAGTVLAATYPWLRRNPLEVATALVGAEPTARSALTAVLLLLALSALLAMMARPTTPRHRLCLAPAAVLAALLAVHLPAAPRTIAHPGGKVLDVESPELTLVLLDGGSALVLDTHLTHAHGLAAGAPVAVVRLDGPAGSRVDRPLRMGLDTGEWAAARPDVATRPGLATPAPWLSQVVTGDDGRPFFAHRFRTVLDLSPPSERVPGSLAGEESVRLTLRRAPELPPDITLAVFHVEVRP